MSVGKIATLAAVVFAVVLAAALIPGKTARADSVRALLDFDYSASDLEYLDKSTGLVTQTDTSSWGQKYNLGLEKSFFPNLRLNAGGIFEKQDMDTTIDGVETNSQRINSRPYADLTLDNQLFRGGLGYSKRESEQKGAGLGRTDVNELYSTIFGWKPEGLPSIDLRLDKNELYDKDRQFMDSTTTTTSMTARYNTEKFDLKYSPSLRDLENRIDNFEVRDTNHVARLAYSDNYFNKRTTFGATYNINARQQDILSHGAGELSDEITQLVAGLFVASDSPTTAILSPLATLIDGLYAQITTVNLGTNAAAERKNLGLNFGIVTEVNSLRVYVDKNLASAVSDWFSWDIYSSDDNTTWQFERTVSLAPFNTFQNYFEIDFPSLSTRYIKVVVRPLRLGSVPGFSADPQYADIFVTELEAYVRTPLPDGHTKNSSTTHLLNLDARTRVMDEFPLFHDASFFLSQTTPGRGERTTLSNALSASHRFNPILSGNARILREDINELTESGAAHGISAALRADPLQTLSNTLVYSGRQEKIGEEDSLRNSLFLQNRAALYQGVDVFLDGGLSRKTEAAGEQQDTVLMSLGTNVVPHRTMTLTGNYTQSTTDTTGGLYPDAQRKETRMDVGISYRPFQTVYLSAALSQVEQETRTDTLKNYSMNWSPFPYGTLQLQFDYSEELRTEDEAKVTTIRPGIRWAIAPKIALTVSYLMTESESLLQNVEIQSIYANIKLIY